MSNASSSRPRPQLGEEAASYVRGLIMAGELRPGDSVRSETISEALDISTTPAREALQALRVEGFLELLPRRGFIVAPLTGKDIRDIFRTQALIAGELAALAARNASDADIAELEELHRQLISAAERKDFGALEEFNHAFHRKVNLSSGSLKISWMLRLTTRYVPRDFYSTIPGWPEATVHDHEDLLTSMRNRDAESTRTLMEAHIEHSGVLLAEHFDARIASDTL
jgi:DNA-binding GntR family transcriptional regulator